MLPQVHSCSDVASRKQHSRCPATPPCPFFIYNQVVAAVICSVAPPSVSLRLVVKFSDTNRKKIMQLKLRDLLANLRSLPNEMTILLWSIRVSGLHLHIKCKLLQWQVSYYAIFHIIPSFILCDGSYYVMFHIRVSGFHIRVSGLHIMSCTMEVSQYNLEHCIWHDVIFAPISFHT